jgi:hypothetical protein
MRLRELAPFQPAMSSYLSKYPEIEMAWDYDRLQQTYIIPPTAFQAANPAFDSACIRVLRLRFPPGCGAGYLDNIGVIPE